MPRVARVKGINTTYHIIMRGNERKNIFKSDDDKARFIYTIIRMKEKYNFIIEAYCIMDNHVHLLINDNENDISKIMKSINISYAYYYNKVYKRVGHLFQDRFLSEVVGDDKYLVEVSAYIHNNPVRASMVKRPEEYRWSSMTEYINDSKTEEFVYTKRILGIFDKSKIIAINEYYKYVIKYEPTEIKILDINEDKDEILRKSGNYIENYEEAEKLLKEKLIEKDISEEELKKDRKHRQEMMEFFRMNSSLTLKEIGNLCGGFAESTVSLILSKAKNRP